jgi:hypothetical protein
MYQFSVEMLLSNGYKREAMQVLRSHASLLRQFANDCHNLEAKKDYLLQVMIFYFFIKNHFPRYSSFFNIVRT